MVVRRLVLAVLSTLLPRVSSCGHGELKAAAAPPGAPVCALPKGHYAAVFTLRQTEGSCEKAKKESHDSMDFDDQGHYLSPADGLVECQTVQSGCQLKIRCTSGAMTDAQADLDGQLTSDASGLSGVGTVVGTYQGCTKVVYDLQAKRAQ